MKWTKSQIKDEIEKSWSYFEKKVNFGILYSDDFGEFLSEVQGECNQDIEELLQPWEQVYDEWLHWLSALTVILLEQDRKENNQYLKTIFHLTGASTSYANSLRLLLRSGYDTPARSLARILDEHLTTCIVFLYSPTIATEFANCETEKESNHFWFKHLSKDKITKHLNVIEADLAKSKNTTADHSEYFRKWRTTEIKSYSRTIHPSNIGSAMATYTRSLKNPEMYELAIFGQASASSRRTIEFACNSIWYFSIYGSYLLLNSTSDRKPVIKVDSTNRDQAYVVIGKNVMDKIMLKLQDNQSLNTDSGNSPAAG